MWTPLKINNCKLWLDASQISGTNGQVISTWNDLSGNSLNMTGNPTLVVNGQNNKNILQMNTSQNLKLNYAFSNPCTTIVVERLYSLSSSARILTGCNNNWLLGHWGGSEDNAYAEGWITATNPKTATTNWAIYSNTQTGSLSTFRNNKTILASNANGVAPPNGLCINTGVNGGTEQSTCQVAEILVYNRALTTTEINNISDYLNWKWLGGTIPSFMYSKILIKNNNYIMKYVDNSWINTNDTSEVNLSIFSQYGIDDISTISGSKWKELNKFKVYTYIEDTSVSLKTKLTGVPQPQICKMDTNFNLAGIKKVNSLNVTSNITNNGIVKFMLSFNSGSTWYSYDGTNWIEININDLTDCKNNGMTKDTVNSIPPDKLELLRNNSKGMRFAYYVEISNTTDTANIDKLNINVDMEGTWKHIPDNGTVYDYEFKDNTTLKISLYQANTFKINYPQ